MTKQMVGLLFVVFLLVFTSGCLYPENRSSKQPVDPKESILIVQSAVDMYHESTGLLPIKNSGMDTPLYEKYIIDFRKLTDRGYLSRIPSHAFESGGSHYFVLVNVEEKAEVKLLELISVQIVRDIQQKVTSYMTHHSGSIPKGIQVTPNWFSLDYSKLNMDRVQIKSVYSEQFLSLLVHTTGKVFIDYAPEIMKVMQDNGITEADPQLDLRTFLVEQSYYVPGQSLPYYWRDNQPVITDI